MLKLVPSLKAILPINELDQDFALENLCKISFKSIKALDSYHSHTHSNKHFYSLCKKISLASIIHTIILLTVLIHSGYIFTIRNLDVRSSHHTRQLRGFNPLSILLRAWLGDYEVGKTGRLRGAGSGPSTKVGEVVGVGGRRGTERGRVARSGETERTGSVVELGPGVGGTLVWVEGVGTPSQGSRC